MTFHIWAGGSGALELELSKAELGQRQTDQECCLLFANPHRADAAPKRKKKPVSARVLLRGDATGGGGITSALPCAQSLVLGAVYLFPQK